MGADALFILSRKIPAQRPGCRRLYHRAHLRPKTAGVILLYDCLNTPTANFWRFLYLHIAEDKMKIHNLLAGFSLAMLITQGCFAVDCCDLCRQYNPASKDYTNYKTTCTPITGGPTYTPDRDNCILEGGTFCRDETEYTYCVTYYAFDPAKDCSFNTDTKTVGSMHRKSTTITCNDGYFRDPTSSNYMPICLECPDNATCTDEKYTCNPGYAVPADLSADEIDYVDGEGCVKCPANATCYSDGSFKCNKYYYLNSAKNGCTKCPEPGMTPVIGATSITSCFIYPIKDNNRLWYDQSGYFNVSENCWYSTTGTPQYPVLGAGTPK